MHRRVGNVLSHVAAGSAASTEPPAVPAAAQAAPDELPPPALLTDEQVKSYVQNGFLALPVTDFPPEWHTAFWQKCHDWSYADQAEKQEDSRHVFPHIPELGAVLSSRVMRGALSSILGPDYVQHPHRTMHNYGNRNGDPEMAAGSDQTWHKDGHHVPMRSHFPRWSMVFYFPSEVTEDMGPTGVIPGATYTTVDRSDRSQDFLEDILETYLDSDETAQARKANMATLTEKVEHAVIESGQAEGEAARLASDPGATSTKQYVADQMRGLGESAAMTDLGASPPRHPGDRAVFGDPETGTRDARGEPAGGFGPGKWKLLCKPGTAVLLDYNMFHRGTRRMPGSLWRAMFKLQFYRVSAPAAGGTPSWDSSPASAMEPAPFASVPDSTAGQREIWTAMWRWMRGEAPVMPPALPRLLGSSSATVPEEAPTRNNKS